VKYVVEEENRALVAALGRPRTVLDVGCGIGLNGAAAKRRGARVTGLEIVPSSIERARKVLDEVIATDITSDAAVRGALGARRFDAMLFADVLEHMIDPRAVLERFLPKSTYSHHGERVVAGQRLMQAATDIFLGWQRIKGLDGVSRDYYVRQFQDWKGSADVDSLLVPGATLYSRICGATLARAHARWGDRIAIASYLGRGDAFDRAIADFSVAYADQTERDYAAFSAAVDSGRLVAQTGR